MNEKVTLNKHIANIRQAQESTYMDICSGNSREEEEAAKKGELYLLHKCIANI